MIRNYIFDFGNVLGQFDPAAMTALWVDDPDTAATVSQVAYDRLYWDKLDDGTITDEAIREDIFRRLPEALARIAWEVYEKWIISMPPVPGMEVLVKDIKCTGGRIYLLSNISIGFAEGYRACPWIKALFSHFDGLVFSGPVGLVKPHEDIFHYLLEKYDLHPEECIFIDDRQENISGAEAVGIQGYLFDGDAEKLRSTLGIPRPGL